MGIIQSHIDIRSEEYKAREKAFALLCEQLETLSEQSWLTLSREARTTAQERKKLTVEERIEALVDTGSPITNLCPFAGYEMYGNDVPPGAGLRTCLASVSGRTTILVANDPAVKGGTYFPMTVKKHLRAQQIALENHLPCIYLVDSGGAFLPLQDQVFPDREHFGRIFFNQARMSALNIPQISVVLGSCTAGGAYVPAMSDEAIMVRGNASIFLGGPPLVKAATGEEVSAEELGGADVHCRISGVADHLAASEIEALQQCRAIVSTLGNPQVRRLERDSSPEEPRYPQSEIYGIVGDDLRKGFSMKEILARLLDGSRFHEFKSTYAETLLCGFGHVDGYLLGIIANDGILFSESALKATHFIELCNQRGIPLLFLQNIVGFMVGKQYEHEGIAKHGAKMVSAVATSRVPKLSLLLGGSFGAGNYAMCGRAYDPRFLFSWPNSRISVMGGNQAARVLGDIKRQTALRKNGNIPDAVLESYEEEIRLKYEKEGNPYYASARLWDDGVIHPLHTRKILSHTLSALRVDTEEAYRPGVFRM